MRGGELRYLRKTEHKDTLGICLLLMFALINTAHTYKCLQVRAEGPQVLFA